MRLKPLPPPPSDLEDVARARQAIPLVPGSEMDCCARVMARLDVEDRPEAREWLTLLRALGLVRESAAGYARTEVDLADVDLAEAFLDHVYGAHEAYEALDDESRSPADVFERIEGTVPAWERDKHRGTWREVWRDRTADLLDWFVLLGLAERRDDGYRRTNYDRGAQSDE